MTTVTTDNNDNRDHDNNDNIHNDNNDNIDNDNSDNNEHDNNDNNDNDNDDNDRQHKTCHSLPEASQEQLAPCPERPGDSELWSFLILDSVVIATYK